MMIFMMAMLAFIEGQHYINEESDELYRNAERRGYVSDAPRNDTRHFVLRAPFLVGSMTILIDRFAHQKTPGEIKR